MKLSSNFHLSRLLTSLCLALLLTSCATPGGWLAGGACGPTQQHNYEVGGTISTFDDGDVGCRMFGGYLFTPIQGVVVSYVDLGEPKYDGPAFGGFTDKLSASGIDASYIIGFAPGQQERFTVFSTIGAFTWKQDVQYVDTSGTYNYNDDGTSLSYGIGSEISLGTGAKWGLHFEWQRFTDVGDNSNSGHEYDRDMISVGVDYRFAL